MTDEERNAIVLYRMENARRTLNEIADHCERGYWNTAINRMYYACFYAASALLVANKIVVKSHEGVRWESILFLLDNYLLEWVNSIP